MDVYIWIRLDTNKVPLRGVWWVMRGVLLYIDCISEKEQFYCTHVSVYCEN
jgi:hypothetical protein